MSEIDVERMLSAMTKRQRQTVADYARLRAKGAAIPADVKRGAVDAINVTVVTALWERPLLSAEAGVVLEAVCKALAGKKGETI